MDNTALEAALIAGTDADIAAAYATLAARAETVRLNLLEEQVVILDTETTGFKSGEDRLIEIAAAIMDGPLIVERFSTFVDPGRPIPDEIVELTHITDADVKGAPSPAEAVRALAEFAGHRTLIAHNASFDRGFLEYEVSSDSWFANGDAWIDSLELARIALPRLRSHDMHTLSRAFGVVPSTHRAIDDVEALCAIWRICLVGLLDMPPGLVGFLAHLFEDIDWSLRPLLSTIASCNDGVFSVATLRDARIKALSPKLKTDATDLPEAERVIIDTGEIEEAFSAEGLLGRIFKDYEPRIEQVEFACEVITALNNREHRALDAGTGVGKSMGYLVPLAHYALSNNIRVGIATKTNALLDQLMYHELPALKEALALRNHEDLRYVALKGYDHYPCLRKLVRYVREDSEKTSHADLIITAMLYAYIAQTTFGDLDPLPLYWNSFPHHHISATTEECLHGKCRFFPYRCFIHGARRSASGADIVVTNHALLFRDSVMEGNVLPAIGHWVIDEAHAVEDEARAQLSLVADAADVYEALGSLVMASGKSLTDRIVKRANELEGGATTVLKTAKVVSDAQFAFDMADSFFSTVHELDELVSGSTAYQQQELWISAEVRESAIWGTVVRLGTAFLKRLEAVAHQVGELYTLLGDYPEMLEAQRDLQSLKHRLDCACEALVTIINGDNDNYVFSVILRRSERQARDTLIAAPLDVGAELVDTFYPEMESVIYSSATISTGDSFEYFARSTGLDRLAPDSWRARRFDSSYDFEHQMKVFVLTDIASPDQSSYLADIERATLQIHEALGGGILTLFTNKSEMRTIYDHIATYLKNQGISLLCQGRGTSVKRLRDEFTVNRDSSLFALKSFWEGFDAPGDTLRCVILPKLPFTRPNDPLNCERSIRERESWRLHILPEAIISVKQAAGRLIRSSTDSGFLVLADARLLQKNYGKSFLRALPTTNIQLVTVEELVCYLETQRL